MNRLGFYFWIEYDKLKMMCLTIPAKVVSIEKNKATVDFVGKKQKADTQLVKVKVGDYVMVSNGFVIKKIEPKEAEEIFKIIREK